jgi:hypothetical protein
VVVGYDTGADGPGGVNTSLSGSPMWEVDP